jgi:hypothetical protein
VVSRVTGSALSHLSIAHHGQGPHDFVQLPLSHGRAGLKELQHACQLQKQTCAPQL